MRSKLPLAGKTIILTGSAHVASVLPFIEAQGAAAHHVPLLTIQECIEHDDAKWLARCNDYEWLIFTSQNAVTAFLAKLARAQMPTSAISCRIAAVGEKTAAALRAAHFTIDFMPTVYSADYFVAQFPRVERALFLRGNLAKATIAQGTGADEWTVYETVANRANITRLDQAIVAAEAPIVVFASPSAVEVYAQHIVPMLGWHCARYASIGHVTTAALQAYGVPSIIQPTTYTMQAVIEQIILEVSTR